jgi:hypothetical protein
MCLGCVGIVFWGLFLLLKLFGIFKVYVDGGYVYGKFLE